MLQKESNLLLATVFIVIGTVSVLGVLPVGGAQSQPSGYAATMPTGGGKLDLTSSAAVAYANYLANQHSLAKSAIAKQAPSVQILYEYYTVLNGFAIKLNGYSLSSLQNVGGITVVSYSSDIHYDMNRSNTLIGSATLWSADGGQSNAGAGMKIGIIDTGIDFTHPFLTDNSLTVPAGYPKCDALDSAVGQPNTSCRY